MKGVVMALIGLLGLTTVATVEAQNIPEGAYTGMRWKAEAARLTKSERSELSSLTDGVIFPNGNGESTWNTMELRWEQDFRGYPDRKGLAGPRAVLPMELARKWPKQQAKQREAKRDSERKEGTRGNKWATWDGENYYSDEGLMGATGLRYIGPVIWHEGAWVEDAERVAIQKKEQAEAEARALHLRQLWTDLRTRVVSDSEFMEVLEIGTALVPASDGGETPFRNGESISGDYYTIVQQRRAAAAVVFNNALLNQFKMRQAEAKPDAR